MSFQEEFKSHMDGIRHLYDQGVDGERELNNHLQQVFNIKEKHEQINRQKSGDANELEMLHALYPILEQIIEKRPLNGRLKDTRHELRMTTMQLYSLFYTAIAHDPRSLDQVRRLVKISFGVLQTDSEEIGDHAIKILMAFTDQHAQHIPRPNQPAAGWIQFSEFRTEIMQFFDGYLKFLAKVPMLARDQTQQEIDECQDLLPPQLRDCEDNRLAINQNYARTFTTFACRSLKPIQSKFTHQLLRQRWDEHSSTRIIEDVKMDLLRIFSEFNNFMAQQEQVHGQQQWVIKSVPFFVKGLENMSILFHAVQYLIYSPQDPLFASNFDFIRQNFQTFVHFFIRMTRTVPGHAVDIRYQIMLAFYQIFNKMQQMGQSAQKDDSNANPNQEEIKDLHQTLQTTLLQNLDQMLEITVLLGSGHVSNTILHEAANLVYRLFEYLKDRMELPEFYIAKSMQMLLVCLLNPLTPLILKSTIIFCLYKFNIEIRETAVDRIRHPRKGTEVRNYDLQVEIFEQMTIMCKKLRQQTEMGINFFNEQKEKPAAKLFDEPEESIDEIFLLKERDTEMAFNNSFSVSWKHICQSEPSSQRNAPAPEESVLLSQKKEHYSRTAKNLFLFVENILILIKALQKSATFSPQVMGLLKRFFVDGAHLIQNLSEIMGPNEENKMKEVCKSFQILLQQLKSSQFRDLLNEAGDEFFGLVIEAKVKQKEGGISIVCRYFMTFQPPQNPNQNQLVMNSSGFTNTYLESFFNYIRQKLPVFDPANEEKPYLRFGLSKQDRKLAQLPFQKVQEAMQKKLFTIGEQCLNKANDTRVKHTFFGVFVFCVQQIRSGFIQPRYFMIIRNLCQEICNQDENAVAIKEIYRDFIPMVQGLIETFLQQKDEVAFVKYTKEICCFVPTKLKHLLDFLPAISKPLIENMESNSSEQVESGIHILQYWLTALATYPELFHPVVQHVLPELNASLKTLLTYMPNISLKLMGKLGAKTRQYDRNNEFKPRNYSEDGLKIYLQDKHSKEEILLGIDAIIDVLLIKILSYGEQFQPQDLQAAVDFVKGAFLTYVDQSIDLDYVIASVISAPHKNQNIAAPPLYPSFDARQQQEPISQMTHGSESHVFEKILRCLIIGCSSLPMHTPQFEAVAREHKKFMKWVTQYFTLIYICKNDTLGQQNQVDEINPLLFLDYIVEFLYYNINQGFIQSTKQSGNKSMRPYYKGSSYAIKTMLKLLTKLYEDQPDAFDQLEIIPILIQKICSQVEELPKNLAVNIAIQILIQYLPKRTMKQNCHLILKTLFNILTQSTDAVVLSVQDQLRPTLNSLFETIGVYTFKIQAVVTQRDKENFDKVIDRIMQNLLSPQQAARDTALHFLETIAKRNNIQVNYMLKSVSVQQQLPTQISWHEYLLKSKIDKRIKVGDVEGCFAMQKEISEMYNGGFCQLHQLMASIELIQFMVHHGDLKHMEHYSYTYFKIIESLLKTLEEESDKFEQIIEQSQEAQILQIGPNVSIQKLTRRYMKLERLYLQQNKEYEPHSHTMHAHQYFQTHYFEVTQQAKLDKQEQLRKDIDVFLRQKVPDTVMQEPLDWNTRKQALSHTKAQIDDFTQRMFASSGQGQFAQGQRMRVQDVSFEYMHDLYELYPNVRLRCRLICKMLEAITDIVSQPAMHQYLKPRQQQFFDRCPNGQEEPLEQQDEQKIKDLNTKLDFYAVEIKAKVICVQFKFFQRDERVVQKSAKRCLKRLLSKEQSPSEALPNFILKECVRPILNSLSSGQRMPSNFQHLGKLIKVCAGCFNEALSKHLARNYESLEAFTRQPYESMPDLSNETSARESVEFYLKGLIEHYNNKVQSAETAIGIMNCFHHLSLSHQKQETVSQITDLVWKSLSFEQYLVNEFDEIFEQKLKEACRGQQQEMQRLVTNAYEKLSPMRLKVGYLVSDLRLGIAKYFTFNFQSAIEILNNGNNQITTKSFYSTFLILVKQKENYALRERITRDTWVNRLLTSHRQAPVLLTDSVKLDPRFVLAVELVYTFCKFHPQYLINTKNVTILDWLREKWINKVTSEDFLQSEVNSFYLKIQKTLVIYCRQENSEIQILFDLLKDFQLHSISLDMGPLVKLCTKEIPLKATIARKQKILEQALSKMLTSNCRIEAKYCMFEFAFMPIALHAAKDPAEFNQLFSETKVQLFLRTFFMTQGQQYHQMAQDSLIRISDQPLWKVFMRDLEQRMKVNYQSFFTEIVKMLIIFTRYFSYSYMKMQCGQSDMKPIIEFLIYIVQNVNDQPLKELTFYCLSCIGIRMIDKDIYGQTEPPRSISLASGIQCESDAILKEFIDNLSNHCLAPFFELEFQKVSHKSTLKATISNLVTFFDSSKVRGLTTNQAEKMDIWFMFKRKFAIKQQMSYRLTLCNMIAKQATLSSRLGGDKSSIFKRLYKTVWQFMEIYSSDSSNVLERMPDFVQALNLQKALLEWFNQRKEQIEQQPQNQQIRLKDLSKEVGILHDQTYNLFFNLLYSYPQQQPQQPRPLNKGQIAQIKSHFSEIATNCQELLFSISKVFHTRLASNYNLQNLKDANHIQLKTIFWLNQCGRALDMDQDASQPLEALDRFVKLSLSQEQNEGQTPQLSFSFINFKLVLYPIYLLQKVLRRGGHILAYPQYQQMKETFKAAMLNDVKKANDRDIAKIQSDLVRNFFRDMGHQQQGPQQLYGIRLQEMNTVQAIIPHFSIRVMHMLQSLNQEGVLSNEELRSWVDNELYSGINSAVFRVVSSFRSVVTSEKSPQELQGIKHQTYKDFKFENGLMDFSLEGPNPDVWIKESIMMTVHLVIQHIKRSRDQTECFYIFEQAKLILKVYFLIPKVCSYLLEQLYGLVKMILMDDPTDCTKFKTEEKFQWIKRLLDQQKLKDLQEDSENPIVNSIYELAVDFLESQNQLLLNENALKVFHKLFQMKQSCNYRVRQRIYQLFEKFQGAALKTKLQFFFQRMSSDDSELFTQFAQVNLLLDFTLFNFKKEVSIFEIKESSRLTQMHNPGVKIVVSEETRKSAAFQNVVTSLEFFNSNLNGYKRFVLEDLMQPLSEIIRINPEHSHDRDIAGKIFSKIFWQYWQQILQRQDHVQLGADFNKMLQNIIKYPNLQTQQSKVQFARTMLEQIVALKNPQVRIEPEILQFMGKNFNLWHLAIPMLEDHISLFPQNERYFFALQELYSQLMEEDLTSGLSRLTTKSPEMRSLYTFAQHNMWEQINSQFSLYINFYAEQEGLFSYLEEQQRFAGKYSRQLYRNALINLANSQDPNFRPPNNQNPENATYSELFENNDIKEKLKQPLFPRAGSNRNISEIDLRQWECLFMQSLKVLKRNEQFKDMAENFVNREDVHDFKIDYYWSVKDMQNLEKLLEKVLGNRQQRQMGQIPQYFVNPAQTRKVRYYLYQNYLLGTQGDRESRNFDENFRETVKLAIKQWSEHLPSYMDNVQNEYLILFQQIMESNEGGRNMISNDPLRNRASDYRNAMNIWRERLPNKFESINAWQEILESRNFIFQKLKENLSRHQHSQPESLGQQQEPVDIVWNNLKLASVSRKHGYYGLAHYYLKKEQATLQDPQTKGDILLLERFKYQYEINKLCMVTQTTDVPTLTNLKRDNEAFIANEDYDLWMSAEIIRLQGEQLLAQGDLKQAKFLLLKSIRKHKKEAKTWLSYSRLNELVHQEKHDEKSLMNALKGYFCAVGLSQHKARFYIPNILRILQSEKARPEVFLNFIYKNVEQMPAWLWLFWIPQLIKLLHCRQDSLPLKVAAWIFHKKVCKLYPQATFYPIEAKLQYQERQIKDTHEHQQLKSLRKKIRDNLELRGQRLVESIDTLSQEISKQFQNGEDQFLVFLQKFLDKSQLLNTKNVEQSLPRLYQQVQSRLLRNVNADVRNEYQKHFIDEDTREQNLTAQMQLLKNIKDYILIQKNLQSPTQTLEEIFPRLVGLQVKGIELPDQFILSAQEPLPERVVTIQSIDQAVQRASIIDKRVQFRCSNARTMAYVFSNKWMMDVEKKEAKYDSFVNAERVNQLKLVINMIFQRNKESMRRGVKFDVMPRTLLAGCKMTQEDLSYTDFQETHDNLLLEQGIDPDFAFLSNLQQIDELFSALPEEERLLHNLSAEQIQAINERTYKQMCNQVEPHLLQSYFNRIFYNHDNLFVFKKQFTKYHAVNSLFTYVFNQTDEFRLSNLSICKATGSLNFTEAKFADSVIRDVNQLQRRPFEELEAEQFRMSKDGVQVNYQLPFRLTPNLTNFIGTIGLHGIFAGVITAASLALVDHENKLGPLLRIALSEELGWSQEDPLTSANVQFLLSKIRSLSQHRRVLEQVPKNESLKAPALMGRSTSQIKEDTKGPNYIFGEGSKEIKIPKKLLDLEMERPDITEEFNHKVFKLIEMSLEEPRLSQRKKVNWCAWF